MQLRGLKPRAGTKECVVVVRIFCSEFSTGEWCVHFNELAQEMMYE